MIHWFWLLPAFCAGGWVATHMIERAYKRQTRIEALERALAQALRWDVAEGSWSEEKPGRDAAAALLTPSVPSTGGSLDNAAPKS